MSAPTRRVGDRFAPAAQVADATLYEGYVLYPYRSSSTKNRSRWQFGVLAPPAYVARDRSERSSLRTECVAEASAGAVLHVRVRLLHVQAREVQRRTAGGRWARADQLDTLTGTVVGWDEAAEETVEVPAVSIPLEGRVRHEEAVHLAGHRWVEQVATPDGHDDDGEGRIERRREPIDGTVRLVTDWFDRGRGLLRVSVEVANTSTWDDPDADRDEMARHALVAVHVVLGIDDGAFVSSLEPPPEAAVAVAGCENDGLFPVLIGAEQGDDLVLASPIIMYDHPAVAPESPGDLYDATEIDEILALRVLTLTEQEKAEARALDPRAAAIVDRCDGLDAEAWSNLHGTIRSFGPADPATGRDDAHQPAAAVDVDEVPQWGLPPVDPRLDEVEPGRERVVVDGVEVVTGTKVVLRPSRRADAQDLFLAGRPATVGGVHRDVNGLDVWVAVSVDDDPATEVLQLHGRYLWFHPEEVDPVAAGRDGAEGSGRS